MKKILLLCMFVSTFVFAQNNQAKLAYQHYQNGQYDKAIELYKELKEKLESLDIILKKMVIPQPILLFLMMLLLIQALMKWNINNHQTV